MTATLPQPANPAPSAPLVNPWALYNTAGPQPVLLDWSENP